MSKIYAIYKSALLGSVFGAAAAAPAGADAKKGDAKAEAAPAKKEGGKK